MSRLFSFVWPSCKCPSGLYQTVFTASKCCLPLPCTLGLCVTGSRASQLGAVIRGLVTQSLDGPYSHWCHMQRAETQPPFPCLKLTTMADLSSSRLGHGMLLFLFSGGFLCVRAHFSFFDSSKSYQVSPREENWARCQI